MRFEQTTGHRAGPPHERRSRLLRFRRALGRRCPLCAARWPRLGPLTLGPRCRVCDLDLERHESDFFLGAYTLGLGATLLIATVVALAIALVPGVPGPLAWGLGIAVIAGFAIGFHPYAKLLWLAFDVQFRRPEEKDFDDRS